MHSPIPVGRFNGQVGRAPGTVHVSSSAAAPAQASFAAGQFATGQQFVSPFGIQQQWPFVQQVQQWPIAVQTVQTVPFTFQQAQPYNLPQWDLRNLQFVLDGVKAARTALSVGDIKGVGRYLGALTQQAPTWFGINLRQPQQVPIDPTYLNRVLLGIETNLNLARRESASGAGWSALNQAIIWANDIQWSIAAQVGS